MIGFTEFVHLIVRQHHGVSQHQSSISIIAETLPNFEEKSWNPSSGKISLLMLCRVLFVKSTAYTLSFLVIL